MTSLVGRLPVRDTHARAEAKPQTSRARARLGFLGVGWIGRHRLEALLRSGLAEVTALADPSASALEQTLKLAPEAAVAPTLEALLHTELDGIVIATPSAQHAAQTKAALDGGKAVFCQKPLGRTGAETGELIAAARRADRLLGVDFSYRFLSGLQQIGELCQNGELGHVYAAELHFHNAYGPDKPWFYERKLSGGGCVMDLGIHLVDLALWWLGFPEVERVSSRLFARGRPLCATAEEVEDFATARLDLAGGTCVQLSCSWKIPAGYPAIIDGTVYGTEGGAAFHNIKGSFYDFVAERFEGTQRSTLASGSEEWGGRAAVHWAGRLLQNPVFDPAIEQAGRVAEVLDRIYHNAEAPQSKASGHHGATR